MKESQPSVAIIIPCFNRWPHIQEAIDSVLSQTWLNTKCIVVDDASTDDSFNCLKEKYASNPKVMLHQLESNQGQSAARNYGATICNTDYIGFLDSDDLLFTTSVETRIKLAEKSPEFSGIIFGEKIDEKSNRCLLPRQKKEGEALTLKEYIHNRGWLHTNSFIMKRESFLTLNGFDINLRKKEDIEFFIRALHLESGRYAPGPCCIVRSVDSQRARHDHVRIIEQGERFIEKIKNNSKLRETLSEPDLSSLLQSDIKSVINSLYRTKQGTRFREEVRKSLSERKIKLDARLAKRYLISITHR